MKNQKAIIFILIITAVSFFFLGKNFEKKNSVKDISTLKDLIQVNPGNPTPNINSFQFPKHN